MPLVFSHMGQNTVSALFMLFLIAVIYLADRKNFQREGIFFIRRTKKGVNFINSQARKHRRFYAAFGTASVVVSLGMVGMLSILGDVKNERKKSFVFILFISAISAFVVKLSGFWYGIAFLLGGVVVASVVFLLKNALFMLIPSLKSEVVASLQFVLPLKIEGAPVFYVPLPYWLTAILVILIVHEFAHALVARAKGVPVKSVGYGFLAIIPIGFAEPDENVLNRKDMKTRLMVYGSGSFSNFVFGFLFLLAFFPFFFLFFK